MMPFPTAVRTAVRTAVLVTRLTTPTLLSEFLETHHCRRRKYGTGNLSPRPSGAELHTRTRTSTIRSADAAHPGERRRRRVSGVEKEERLEDASNEYSAVANLQFQPRSSLKKYHLEGNSTFVEDPMPPLHLSSSANHTQGESILSSQHTGSHPPQNFNASPMSIDDFDDEEGAEIFRQAPNPPLTKFPSSPHPPVEGVSGKAAAIAYLRIRGLANRSRRRTFYSVLAWILRYAARDLGFEIVPDGFVRVSDLLRFEFFQSYTLETFAKACVDDMFDRFEVISLPDVVDGEMREVWWARARASQTIPGVHASNKRIINMGKLQTVVYRAPFAAWPKIQKYGILEEADRLIRLYQSGEPYFHNIIPRHAKYICISIDAQRAAELGVMFFHTQDVELVAVGRNGAIPFEAIRSVVELEVEKEDLI